MPETITVTKDAVTQLITVTVGVSALPQGGTLGQVLVKKSGTDYDYEWANANSALTAIPSFPTIAALVADTSATLTMARCYNGTGTDHVLSVWMALPATGSLAANGVDVIETDGGVLMARIYSREYSGEPIVPAPVVGAVDYLEWEALDADGVGTGVYYRLQFIEDSPLTPDWSVGTGDSPKTKIDWLKPSGGYRRTYVDEDGVFTGESGDGTLETYDEIVFNVVDVRNGTATAAQTRMYIGDDNVPTFEVV